MKRVNKTVKNSMKNKQACFMKNANIANFKNIYVLFWSIFSQEKTRANRHLRNSQGSQVKRKKVS